MCQEFVDALQKEIELVAHQYSHFDFNSVYFGGGTPTLLSLQQIDAIWSRLNKNFKISPAAEVSIEANPGTIDDIKLCGLREMGFNRLSLGAQSFHPEDLKFLGRIHSVPEITTGVESGRKAGFGNINLDLMTAFPGLSVERFRTTLQRAIALQPEHISCYTLIFEPQTPFFVRMQRGLLKPLSDESEAGFYELANDILEDAGYAAYEISNFSKTLELRCRHNLNYWNHLPYLGLGPSSHSFVSPTRWWNVRRLKVYLEQIGKGKVPVLEEEKLDEKSLEFEYIFLHLRLKEGINVKEYRKRFKKNFYRKYEQVLGKLIRGGFIQRLKNRVFLTRRGWLLADEIASSF